MEERYFIIPDFHFLQVEFSLPVVKIVNFIPLPLACLFLSSSTYFYTWQPAIARVISSFSHKNYENYAKLYE